MKKIPTIFCRKYQNHFVVETLPVWTQGFEWIEKGEGVATEKFDGACCALIDGVFYKRYDAKRGKTPPPGAIPCSAPDPITGHWPHWLKVGEGPEDQWFRAALANSCPSLPDGTYEAVGPHFQNNPHELDRDFLLRHGSVIINLPDRSYAGIKKYLEEHVVEGIVFWKDGEPQGKIKRSDFGLLWPKNNKG